MKQVLTFLVALCLCINVYSEPAVTPAGVPIELHIYDSINGNAYVNLIPHGCSGGKYILQSTHPQFNAIFSMLMAAQMAKHEVAIRFDGCTTHNSPQGFIVGVYLM